MLNKAMEVQHPPPLAQLLLKSFLRKDLDEEVRGDLEEKFYADLKNKPAFKAKLNYWYQVLNYLRPFALRKSRLNYLNNYVMYKSYFKIGWRNLLRNKGYSFINIGGLAIGMAVAMMIGLWIYDELSFNKYHQNYNRIAQVIQNQSFNGKIETWPAVPPVMSEELRTNYGDNFKYVVMTTWPEGHFLAVGENRIPKIGHFMEKDGAELLSLKMLKGKRSALSEPSSNLLSSSTAKVFFGNEDPMDKTVKIDNKLLVKVAGVYEDIPLNSDFNTTEFITTWEQKLILDPWIKTLPNPWGVNGAMVYVQLAVNADINKVSLNIKDSKLKKVGKDDEKFKAEKYFYTP